MPSSRFGGRHADVGQNDIGLLHLDCLEERGEVRTCGGELDVRLGLEQAPDAFPDEISVLGQDDADHRAPTIGRVVLKRLQRRELGLEPGNHELIEPLRLGQVLQAVLAQVAQLVAPQQGGGRSGDQHLPAVAGRGDPGRSVHIDADIPVLAKVRRPSVDANPHLNRARGQFPYCLRSGPHCLGSGWERDEERVAVRIDLRSAVSDERLAQYAAMLRERMRVPIGAQLVQQPCRAFDVGEEEGNRSRWEIARHAHNHAPSRRSRLTKRAPWASNVGSTRDRALQAFCKHRTSAGMAESDHRRASIGDCACTMRSPS